MCTHRAFLAGCLMIAMGSVGCDSSPLSTMPDLSQVASDGGTDDLLPSTDDASESTSPLWTSCGGGSGIGDVTGAQLNVTIGSSSLAGESTAPSGASVTFGLFSDDNH